MVDSRFVERITDFPENLQGQFALLGATEGFPRLSGRQQRIIKISLYIQSRASRHSDGASKRKYWLSRNHIYEWYCHAAIACLEGVIPLTETPDEFGDNFFKAKYQQIKSLEDAKEIIEKYKFPSVVHIIEEENDNFCQATKEHSFLALGHDSNKNIIVYDKEGYGHPYRITDLSAIYESYGDSYWGVRKLGIR